MNTHWNLSNGNLVKRKSLITETRKTSYCGDLNHADHGEILECTIIIHIELHKPRARLHKGLSYELQWASFYVCVLHRATRVPKWCMEIYFTDRGHIWARQDGSLSSSINLRMHSIFWATWISHFVCSSCCVATSSSDLLQCQSWFTSDGRTLQEHILNCPHERYYNRGC